MPKGLVLKVLQGYPEQNTTSASQKLFYSFAIMSTSPPEPRIMPEPQLSGNVLMTEAEILEKFAFIKAAKAKQMSRRRIYSVAGVSSTERIDYSRDGEPFVFGEATDGGYRGP